MTLTNGSDGKDNGGGGGEGQQQQQPVKSGLSFGSASKVRWFNNLLPSTGIEAPRSGSNSVRFIYNLTWPEMQVLSLCFLLSTKR